MSRLIPVLAAFLFSFALAVSSGRAASPFETISGGATPAVAYAVDYDATVLTVQVRVGAVRPGLPSPRLHLGVSAAQTVILDQTRAKIEPVAGSWLYTFTLPGGAFASPDEVHFRWALLVEWVDTAGEALQRQNYFTPTTWPPFRDIGRDPAAWTVFNLSDYRTARERLARRIVFTVDQPFKGKASIVIEDTAGRRIRNLVSGQPFAAGPHEFAWDGLDENGRLVAPGEYHWRAISHPGIRPELLMYFYAPGEKPWAGATWLADHTNPTSAAAYGDHVVLGAPVAESGNNIVLADLDGNKVAAANLSSFVGLGHLYLALGPDRIYALSEGSPGYNSVRRNADGSEYAYGDISLVRWDFSGNQERYDGKSGEHVVLAYRRPLSEGTGFRKDRVRLSLNNLRGAVYLGGLLYLSLHDDNRILIIDPADGREAGSIAAPAPGPIATDGKALYGLSGTHVFRIAAPKDGAKAEMLFSCRLSDPLPVTHMGGTPWNRATALAAGPRGELFVADNGTDQNIKVYSLSGKLLREIGPRGGRAPEGPWNGDAIRRPSGLAVDSRGRLWLAEDERTPKRISVWDTDSGRVLKEIFGPPPYGGTNGGFDPQDATRWFAAGCMWKIDYQTKQATLQSVLHHQTKPGELADVLDGNNIFTVHRDGRTFLIAKGRYLQIFELLPGGSTRLWAVLGSLATFEATAPRWSVPAVFTEHPALKGELEDFTETIGEYGDLRRSETASRHSRDYTILWIDRNGDEVAQVDELQVSASGPQLAIPGWSAVNPGLDLGFAVNDGKASARVTLRLHGFLPSGAPDWRLGEAYAGAVPIKDYTVSNLGSSLTDRQGRLILSTSPMVGIAPDGGVRWRLRNDWSNVHGSHNAPLPETGVMQGTLGFLGDAPFDSQGDVTVIGGNHGRFFALTTDGIYLDEFFEDVRVAIDRGPMRVGGEAFGGFFARDEKTGRYLLQAGHGAYRIYELKGMDKLVRSAGDVTVTAEQLSAAQKLNETRVARATVRKETSLGVVAAGVALPELPADWPGGWTAEWGDVTRRFPFAHVKALRQGDSLVLGFEVKDPTPWVNRGVDRNLLFKTGDAVDFEFSTDPSASASRRDPVPGDRRLLIAGFAGRPVAMLYDYRVPGSTDPVLFNSPWRSARVDRVGVIADAVIDVQKTSDGYTLTARLPLAELGLPSGAFAPPLLADFGVIYGDEEGESDILRSYWSNASTGLVNDVPGETMINPSLWGLIHLE